jgi:hypothetical protein
MAREESDWLKIKVLSPIAAAASKSAISTTILPLL